jgi:hypothetical protein
VAGFEHRVFSATVNNEYVVELEGARRNELWLHEDRIIGAARRDITDIDQRGELVSRITGGSTSSPSLSEDEKCADCLTCSVLKLVERLSRSGKCSNFRCNG